MPPIQLLDIINAQTPAIKTRVVTAFAKMHGRPDEIVDPADPPNKIPNPQSEEDFMRAIVITFIRETVEGFEGEVAGDSARETARTKARNEINPT